jgi:pSer/pThr/pTyr-binding forkhead associated (FHA) protein
MGGMQDMEATVMVDASRMAQAFVSSPDGAAPAASGPRKLVVLKGEANVRELIIERDVVTIGKAPTCDLIIKGFFLDKIEATLTQKNDRYYLVPMGGGVRYGAEKLDKEQVLKIGDTFVVGKTTLAFT